MRLRAVEQVIGLTEIFGQQLQTGEHLLHICGGRADGAAVETLRRVRIKRRLLPAIFLSCFCAVGRSGLRNLVNPENAPQYLDIFSAKRRKKETGTKFLFIHPGT